MRQDYPGQGLVSESDPRTQHTLVHARLGPSGALSASGVGRSLSRELERTIKSEYQIHKKIIFKATYLAKLGVFHHTRSLCVEFLGRSLLAAVGVLGFLERENSP